MSNLINYLIVDIDNGKWDWNKEMEHHSIAVPKMLNKLELRIEKIVSGITSFIRNSMYDTVYNRNLKSLDLNDKGKDVTEELYLHYYMLSDFKRKVLTNMSGNVSPIMKLKMMDSPLKRKYKPVIAQIYEHFDDEEIETNLEKMQEKLDNSVEQVRLAVEIWEDMLKLAHIYDVDILLTEIKAVNEKLKKITDPEMHAAFFALDDATKGLLKQNVKVKIDLSDAFNKIIDFILRSFIKSLKNNNVEKAFDRLKQLKIYDAEDMDLSVLKELKFLLETQSLKPSYNTCYKKIGEMHANMHLKLFEIESLKHLRKYFKEETVFLVDVALDEFNRLHNLCIKKEEIDLDDDKSLIERNISELEIYSKVIEDLLLDCEPGKAYFYLSSKVHSINTFLASKYYILNLEDCKKNLEIIGSDLFRTYISSLNALMFALREEVKVKRDADLKDLSKVGLRTGKTTMIDTYEKAINEILAALGTFMANTLHNLIKEILQNLESGPLRNEVSKTYTAISTALSEFNRESSEE